MKKTELRTAPRPPASSVRRLIAWASGCLSLASLAACSGAGTLEQDCDIVTWEQFREQAVESPNTGSFVVDGDLYARDEAELRAIYDRWLANELHRRASRLDNDLGRSTQPLVAESSGGFGVRWPPGAAADLSYCVVKSDFGDRYDQLVSALHTATNDWEATGAQIAFRHAQELDVDCSTSSAVRSIFIASHDGSALATAATYRYQTSLVRMALVRVDDSSFAAGSPPLDGIMRHELGHVLGFFHEHARTPIPFLCSEMVPELKELTSVDSNSVMYYDWCPGSTHSNAYQISDGDIRGARSLYGGPMLTNVVISGGTGTRNLLSVDPSKSSADLWTTDDGSSRQRWFIKKSQEPHAYNIVLDNGAAYLRYLSVNSSGDTVGLYHTDDGSGRQRWRFEYGGAPGLMHILVQNGVTGGRKYLSATPDGTKVDLWASDDGSGRQRWKWNIVGGGMSAQ